MTEKTMPEKLWTPMFTYLLLLGTLTNISFFMINPIISKYATLLGTSLGVAGVIAGLFSITALTARPAGAVIVDRMNRKYVLAGATAMMGVAALGYSIANGVAMLIVFRILHGIAFAISGTAIMAFIASVIPRSRLGEGMGYYSLTYIIATAIGPSIGILLADKFSYKFDFLISGLTLFLSAFLITRLKYKWERPESHKAKKKIGLNDLISVKVLPLAFFGCLFSFSNGTVTSFLVLVGEQRSIANISLYFTVMAVFVFLIRPFVGKLSDNKGLAIIIYPAFILLAVESLLLANASVLWVVLIAAVAKAFGQGGALPALQAASLRKLDPSKAGVASATYFIGADIGQGVGPMIGGKIAQSYSYAAMFYFCMGLMIAGFLLFILYDVYTKKRDKAKSQESLPA